MAMREDGNITLQRPEPSNQPICAFGNLGGRFAARTTVSKDIPAWPTLANISRALSLVVPIVTPPGPARFQQLVRPTHMFAARAASDW